MRLTLFLRRTALTTAAGNSLTDTTTNSGVCPCSLSSYRQIAAMPGPAVTADLLETLDVRGNLTSEFSFDGEVVIDNITDAVDLFLAPSVCNYIRVDLRFVQDF